MHGARANRGYAVHPRQYRRCCIQNTGHGRGAKAREPQRVVDRKVSNAGHVTQQKGMFFQHMADAAQVGFITGSSIHWREARHTNAHLGTVITKRFSHGHIFWFTVWLI